MRRIAAVGGGGFNFENPTPKLNQWFLNLAEAENPRILFIPTASGDSFLSSARFFRACAELDCRPSVLELFRRGEKSVEEHVSEADLVWVGGGNTVNLILLWRFWGLDLHLRAAYDRGVPVGGVSAGANCWFESYSTDSFGLPLQTAQGLGWVKGSFCPHFDSEPERLPTLTNWLEAEKLPPGWAADEKTALLIEDERPMQAVSESETGGAYAYRWQDDLILEPWQVHRL